MSKPSDRIGREPMCVHRGRPVDLAMKFCCIAMQPPRQAGHVYQFRHEAEKASFLA